MGPVVYSLILPKCRDRIFYRWVIFCFHLESCPSDPNLGERSCSQPAKCVTLAIVWTTRPERILSHVCTRESCLHQPLLQLAKPYKSLTLHLQFRKQPVLGPSSLGCTRLQFGKVQAPSCISNPGEQHTIFTLALIRVLLVLLSVGIQSDGGGWELLHSSFALFPPPVLVFFLLASCRAKCTSLSPHGSALVQKSRRGLM